MKYLLSEWPKLKGKLKDKPVALFLDFDGTLTPIAPKPSLANLPQSTKNLLKTLSQKAGWKISVVSGRGLKDLETLVDIKGIFYSGNHGLEIKGPGISFADPVPKDVANCVRTVHSLLKKNLSKVSGVVLEDKFHSISVHYRLVAPAEGLKIKPIILEAVERGLEKKLIKLRKGKKVYEVLPNVDWDKGRAVRWLLKFWSSDEKALYPVGFGDDLTDEDVFQTLKKDGLTIRVGQVQNSNARYYLNDPDEVIQFLKLLQEL